MTTRDETKTDDPYETRARRLNACFDETDERADRFAQRAVHRLAGLQHGMEACGNPYDFGSDAVPGLVFRYVNTGDTYDGTLVCIESLPDGVEPGASLGWIVNGVEQRTWLREGWHAVCWGDVLEEAELAFQHASGLERCRNCGAWAEYVDHDENYGSGACTECHDGLRAE